MIDDKRLEEQRKDVERKSKPYLDDDSKSDLSNDMRYMSHYKNKKRSLKVLYFLEKVIPELNKHKLLVGEFNDNSFRITDGIKQVDFYPSSGKLFTNDKVWITLYKGITESILKELI